MRVTDHIAAHPDCRLTFWIHIEGLDSLIVQHDGPSDPGDYSEVWRILDQQPLETKSGVDSALRGQPVSCSLSLRLSDPLGRIAGLLDDTPTTRLYSPVQRTDNTISVVDASGLPASGYVYVGRETIAYAGKSAESGYDLLTGCSRAQFSEGYVPAYTVGDDGVFPVYPVRLNPGRLEGRYVELYAMPLAPSGEMLYEQNEAIEIWRGIIDSVPRSVDGSIWTLQCRGLESLLSQTVRNENRGRALVVQPIWEPNVTDQIVIQPDSVIRVRVRRERWVWDGGRDLEQVDATDWIEAAIPAGIYQDVAPIGKAIADAINAADPTDWPEFESGTDCSWGALLIDGVFQLRCRRKTQHWPAAVEDSMYAGEDDPNVFFYEFWFDFASQRSKAFGLQDQLKLPPEYEQWSTKTATMDRWLKEQTGWSPPDPDPDDWPYWPTDFDYYETIKAVIGEAPVLAVHVSKERKKIAVEFPDGAAWTREGHLLAGEEVLVLRSLALLDWGTQTGDQVWALEVYREQGAKTPWTVEVALSQDSDPVEIEPRLVIAGASALRCAIGLLAGVHEAAINTAYSEDIGAGIYAAHLDLTEFARLLQAPNLTGGRRAIYEDEIRIGDWIAQNLALEELAIIPCQTAAGQYKLRPVKISTAPSLIHAPVVDWEGALQITSGLGTITNQIEIQEEGGSGKYRDLDSLTRYGVSRSENYNLARIASADGLANMGLAAARIFSSHSFPRDRAEIPVSAAGRTIEPGDGIEIVAGALPTYWVVESTKRSWIGGRDHCVLACREIQTPSFGHYCPVAEIASVDGNTATVTDPGRYSQGDNPFSKAESRAVDYFAVGDSVVVFDPEDQYTENTSLTITVIDSDASTITFDDAPTNGHYITLYTRATASTQSAERYVWGDEEDDWI